MSSSIKKGETLLETSVLECIKNKASEIQPENIYRYEFVILRKT